MATRLDNIREERIKKLEELKKLHINPFAAKINLKGKLIKIADARDKHDIDVLVAGRVMGMRGHGAILFGDIKDESGTIQLFFKEDVLKEKYPALKLIDTGDFLAVAGKVMKTQAGEITVEVKDFQLLTKSIRPLPSEWYGLKDEEERYRQRYVDLILNEDLKDLFRKKALFWQSMRNFLIEKGFLEVETPALENTAGGADANPFITHHQALDIDLYLRISMGELWQKRLMVAGFDKTFEIGRQFRNEGMDREHLQDYSQMEFYWAYANYEDSMELVEELYKFVAKATFNTTKFKIGEHEVDLGKTWKRIDYVETIKEKMKIDISTASDEDLKEKLKELKISFDTNDERGRLIDLIWKQVRKNISGPVFLIGHPVEVSPLAKRMEERNQFVERYQVILAGSEMGNGYSELNDPIDQAQRFKKQQEMRDKGDDEAQMQDDDFVRALEYGMPPTTGFGVSERLFSFLANLSVREAVLFPLLRPEK